MTQEAIDRITLEALLYQEALNLYCRMLEMKSNYISATHNYFDGITGKVR